MKLSKITKWALLAIVLAAGGTLAFIKCTCNLGDAVYSDHGFTAACLVLMGADVNAPDENGETPLLHALRGRNEKMAGFLLDFGADVNRADEAGKTPLMAATEIIDPFMVKWLLAKGADVHATDSAGRSALDYLPTDCIEDRDTFDIFSCLLDAGATVRNAEEDGCRLLSLAIDADPALAKRLLDAGASADSKDAAGTTALMMAVGSRDAALVRLLLERGADAAAVNQNGWDALAIAAEHGDAECASLLLEKTAYTPRKARDQMTALQRAAVANSDAVVSLLINNRAPGADLREDIEMALLRVQEREGYGVVVSILGKEQWRFAMRETDPDTPEPAARAQVNAMAQVDIPSRILALDKEWYTLDKKGKDVVALGFQRISGREALLQTMRKLDHVPMRVEGSPVSVHLYHNGVTQQDLEALLDIPELHPDAVAAIAVMIHEYRFGVTLRDKAHPGRTPMEQAHTLLYGEE